MIEIADLHFRYPKGEFSLRVPELSVAKRERVAVIGPSGSGKTTLLHLMAGIRTPRGGRVITRGVEVSKLGDAERRSFRIQHVGLVFQEFELLEYLDVLSNILLPYRISPSLHLDGRVKQRARRLAARVGLGDRLGRNVNHLSQGERQRVAVCRALVAEPELLLADEPTGNLDPTNKDRVLKILLDFAGFSGATLVTVTHDHDLLSRFERVIDFRQFCDVGPGRPASSRPSSGAPGSRILNASPAT